MLTNHINSTDYFCDDDAAIIEEVMSKMPFDTTFNQNMVNYLCSFIGAEPNSSNLLFTFFDKNWIYYYFWFHLTFVRFNIDKKKITCRDVVDMWQDFLTVSDFCICL